MQFPNPIVKSLILYDNNGNAVVILGPGPSMKVVNPSTHAELDVDAGSSFPEVLFWNSAHSDFGKISLEVNPAASPNQMMEIRSPAENSLVLPGNPLVQMRLFLSALLELGNVMPPNSDTSVGGTLNLDEKSFSVRVVNTSGVELCHIQSIVNSGVAGIVLAATDSIRFGNASSNVIGVVYDVTDGTLHAWDGIGEEQWQTMTMQNGWTNNGSLPLQIRRDPTGRVWARGITNAGAIGAGTILFNIPAGYRPAQEENFHIAADSGADNIIKVATNGNVSFFNGFGGNYYWNSTSWSTT